MKVDDGDMLAEDGGEEDGRVNAIITRATTPKGTLKRSQYLHCLTCHLPNREALSLLQ